LDSSQLITFSLPQTFRVSRRFFCYIITWHIASHPQT